MVYQTGPSIFTKRTLYIGGEKMWGLEMDDLQIINWDVLGGLSKI